MDLRKSIAIPIPISISKKQNPNINRTPLSLPREDNLTHILAHEPWSAGLAATIFRSARAVWVSTPFFSHSSGEPVATIRPP